MQRLVGRWLSVDACDFFSIIGSRTGYAYIRGSVAKSIISTFWAVPYDHYMLLADNIGVRCEDIDYAIYLVFGVYWVVLCIRRFGDLSHNTDRWKGWPHC